MVKQFIGNKNKKSVAYFDIAICMLILIYFEDEGVLHLSKNAGETLGHLGSNTDRWAQSTMTIKRVKETGQLVLEPKFLRSSEDFEPVAISWDEFSGKWRENELIRPPEPIKRGPGRPKQK